jgi:hypothetical protein
MTDALDAKLPHSVAFRNHYARLYVDAQAMAIRRLTDKDHRVQSVARLLIEIRLHRDVMTRSRFIGLRPSDEAARSGVMFDREFLVTAGRRQMPSRGGLFKSPLRHEKWP